MTNKLNELKQLIITKLYNINTKQFPNIINSKENIYIKHDIIKYTAFLPGNTKITERIYCINNNIHKTQKCKECGNPVKFDRFSTGYNTFCSKKCAGTNINLVNIRKETIKKKYGVENISQNKKIKELKKIKSLNNFNNVNFFNSDYFKLRQNENIIQNRLSNYNNYIKMIDTYYLHNISTDEFINKGPNGPYNLQCKKCNNHIMHNPTNNYGYNYLIKCKTCSNAKKTSKYETEIIDYIKSLNIENIVHSDRNILNGKELDIYLPDYDLAIEFNGLMYHSIGKSKHSMFNNSLSEDKLKNNHLYKTVECYNKGIDLLYIFENEWLNEKKQNIKKQNIWKSIIKNKLGKSKNIDINELYLENITDQNIIKNFLDNNHLEGFISSDITIGLFSKISQELVCLISFSENNIIDNNNWKISKYTTIQGYDIEGGYNKIFDYFIEYYMKNGEKIIGLDNLRYANGEIYKQLGFSHIGYSEPDYFYFKEGTYKLENQISYKQPKLQAKLDKFNDDLSESENMYNNGYRKIYDCGNTIFEFIKLENKIASIF